MSSDVREPGVTPLDATNAGAFADSTLQYHVSASAKLEHVASPIDARTAAEALKHGPRGALVLASVSTTRWPPLTGRALRRFSIAQRVDRPN